MTRSYDGARRREQAARTRIGVIDAAASVFGERGWVATTMPAVAEAAGVAVETVYRVVPGGKVALLAEAVRAAVAGGAARAEVAVDDRGAIRRVIDADDPRTALTAYAATLPGTWRRSGPLLTALDAALPDDDGLRRLRTQLEGERWAGMRRFAAHLSENDHLRAGIDVDRAADILWTVCGRAHHEALVLDRGWPVEDYVAWVARTLAGELLTGPVTPEA